MIIKYSDTNENRIEWQHRKGGEWKTAELDELIEAYERATEPGDLISREQADKRKERRMSEIVREMTREELIVFNNELRAENEKLKAELEEARLATEHNRHVSEENQLKYELHYRDGVIYGMKYALRCNGISGGEVDRRDYER